MRVALVAFLLLISFARALHAQDEVFIVRHAEKSDAATDEPKNPDLSPAGHARAESLARMLRDAGITAVYATEFKRTQQTAEPLARAVGVDVTIVPAQDTSALVTHLRETKGSALVVGHSNTIPEIVKALGIDSPIAIGQADYDNVFVIVGGSQSRLVRLHY